MKFTSTVNNQRRFIWVNVEVSDVMPAEGASPPPLSGNPRDPAAPIYVFVSVKDTGPGLTQEDLILLFRRWVEPFNFWKGRIQFISILQVPGGICMNLWW
jgi:signal transduction histidine kinase